MEKRESEMMEQERAKKDVRGNAEKRDAEKEVRESQKFVALSSLAQKRMFSSLSLLLLSNIMFVFHPVRLEQPVPRITHPLPPKPQVLVTGSSYRPARKRERDRSCSRGRTHGRGRTHSRSRSGESRSRSGGQSKWKERSLSKGRKNDVVAEPMAQQDKDDRELEAQARKDTHSQVPFRLDTNKTNCFTNACMEYQLQGDKGTRVGALKIAFASDGRRAGIACESLHLTLSQQNFPDLHFVLVASYRLGFYASNLGRQTPIIRICKTATQFIHRGNVLDGI